MAKKEGSAVSLNPETFTEGGGLIDDVDATITELRFELFDFNGEVKIPTPCLKSVVVVDGENEERTQYYSMGSPEDWLPSEDGTQLLAVGKATGIRMSSNGGIFIKSLVDSGFPADKLSDDISVVDGLECHMIQIPLPERKGIKKTEKQKKKEEQYGPPTILVVSEIRTLPWDKKKGKPDTKKSGGGTKGGKSGGGKKAPPKDAPAGDDDMRERLSELIVAAIAEAGGTLKRTAVAQVIMKAKGEHEDWKDMLKLAYDEEFLSGSEMWACTDNTLEIG